MAKHIVVIDGSPRKGRNTDSLCNAFIEGAEKNGNTVYKFSVSGKKINGCIHCMGCYKNGPCAQKDDMIPLYDELEKADMVVLASPIYFWHITSQLKAVIDRMYAMYVAKRFKPKDTAFIVVSGGADHSNVEEALSFYHNVVIKRLHWNDKGVIEATGTSSDSFDLTPYLEKARALGESIK